ncbi:MAG: efflux RND transporter periplasmic adaptor subunit [Thiotrichales bacterium]|nr:efflux RND transporter periplasmic adaptor subunit [Thiotrichales bacterium]
MLKICLLLSLSCIPGQLIAADLSSDELTNIRGLIKPNTKAAISSEIAAQIEKMPYREGQRFNKGDVLIKFDCSLYHAALASSKATYEASQKRLENNKQLVALDALSNIELELSEIDVKKNRAEMEAARINTSRCRIKAPFNGRVIETVVNKYESVARDQELLSILDDRDLIIELIVPSKWLTWLKEGMNFSFAVDETGKRYSAAVSQLGAVVDPVSQTIRITGRFTETVDVLSGMSGTAKFESIDQ